MAKQSIIWTTRKIRLGNLIEWEKNPVTLTRREAEQIEKSIDKFNMVIPLVANAPLESGKCRLIDGHQRKMVMITLQRASPDIKVDVRIPSRRLTERECEELSIRLRRNTGTWDWDKLANEFNMDDLVDWGFTRFEVSGMDPEPDESERPVASLDQAEELHKAWKVREGDLWEAGDHRILCGDAIEPASYKRLMAGEKAALINTDPPYGVSYESPSGKFEAIVNDELSGDQLVAFLTKSFTRMMESSADDAAFYIWHANPDEYIAAMERVGLIPLQRLVWVKPGATLGRSDYQEQFEMCFYASKNGIKPPWYGGRDETTVWRAMLIQDGTRAIAIGPGIVLADPENNQIFLRSRAPKGQRIRTIRIEADQAAEIGISAESTNVWTVGRDYKVARPTQKPVELAARALRNSTRQGDVVLDPFAGAGFTVIACQVMKRRARAIELVPKYVAVILQRLADEGLEPRRMNIKGE
jgi:DNA modification methylase